SGGVDVAVSWTLSDGRYVTVESIGALSVADTERYARGLHPGSIPGSPTVADFSLAPAGYRLQTSDPQTTCVSALGDAADRRQLVGVAPTVAPAAPPGPAPAGDPLTINDRSAVLSSEPGGPGVTQWTVRIALGGGRQLNVFTAGTTDGRQLLSSIDLVAIATG